jgi:alpha-D-ribose 1-methylphosphonate 5-triphosphate synthase subunit PhnH
MTSILASPPIAFGDHIKSDQRTFRTALSVLSTPGVIGQLDLSPALAGSPSPGNPWTITLLLMLLDHEVSLSLEHVAGADDIGNFIVKRTRTSITSPESADFVLADSTHVDPELPLVIRRGSLHYPDDSATLIVEVPLLSDESCGALQLLLTGPGIERERSLSIAGMSPEFFAARDEANAHYPMGIDMLFVDQTGQIAGLPRTTQVTVHAGSGA